jgi:hypothetical protein
MRILPQQQVMREINIVARGQLEISHGNIGPLDLAEGLAELQLGHVLNRRQFGPSRIGDGSENIQR